jgi:hypothetical protein
MDVEDPAFSDVGTEHEYGEEWARFVLLAHEVAVHARSRRFCGHG